MPRYVVMVVCAILARISVVKILAFGSRVAKCSIEV